MSAMAVRERGPQHPRGDVRPSGAAVELVEGGNDGYTLGSIYSALFLIFDR